MKVKCKFSIPSLNYCKEEIIDIDENELVGRKGFDAKNTIYRNTQKFFEMEKFRLITEEYEIIEGSYIPDIPYITDPEGYQILENPIIIE